MSILSVANPIEVIRLNTKQRVDIQVTSNCTGCNVDATELELMVTDLCDTVLYSTNYFSPPTRIVKPVGTVGQYYITWGDGGQVIPNPVNETDTPMDILFNWRIVAEAGTEEVNYTQVVKVVSSSTLGLLPYFRLLIDKAVKLVNQQQSVFLGYTDSQLIQYLESGLQIINSYQPGSVYFTFQSFPYNGYRQILLEAALIAGVMSQNLFAVDTDVPSYQDSGESFVINHQQPLSNFLNSLTQRLDKLIPAFKLTFVNMGSVMTEMGPNYRLQQVLTASPSGSLFRNVYFHS